MKKLLFSILVVAPCLSIAAQNAQAKYSIKSASFKTVTIVMNQKSEVFQYFDDYGTIEATRTKMNIPMLGSIDMATIRRDGKEYSIDYVKRTVQEFPQSHSINYLDLSDEIVAQYQIRKISEEDMDGRKCTVYSEVVSQNGKTYNAKVWIWEGITLKTVLEMGGMTVTSIVEDFSEGEVSAEKFTIPSFSKHE